MKSNKKFMMFGLTSTLGLAAIVATTSLVSNTNNSNSISTNKLNSAQLKTRGLEVNATTFSNELSVDTSAIDRFNGMDQNSYFKIENFQKDYYASNWRDKLDEDNPERFNGEYGNVVVVDKEINMPTINYAREIYFVDHSRWWRECYESHKNSGRNDIKWAHMINKNYEDPDFGRWINLEQTNYIGEYNQFGVTSEPHTEASAIGLGFNESDDGNVAWYISSAYEWKTKPSNSGELINLKITPYIHVWTDEAFSLKHRVAFKFWFEFKWALHTPNLDAIHSKFVDLLSQLRFTPTDSFKVKSFTEKASILEYKINEIIDNYRNKFANFDLTMELPANLKVAVTYDQSQNNFKVLVPFYSNLVKEYRITQPELLDQYASNQTTSLKHTNIRYDEAIFTDLFSSSGFKPTPWYADYKNNWNIDYNKNAWDNLNNNRDKYFNNPIKSGNIIRCQNRYDDKSENWKVNFFPEINGVVNGKPEIQKLEYQVEFKPTPGIDNSKGIDISGFFNDFVPVDIKRFVDSKHVPPTVNELINLIILYVNWDGRWNQIPTTMRKNGKFNAEDIDRNTIKIDTSKAPDIVIQKGIVLKTPGNVINKIVLPEFRFKVWETTLKETVYLASNPINKWYGNEFVSGINSNYPEFIDATKEWIKNNVWFLQYWGSGNGENAGIQHIKIDSATLLANRTSVELKFTIDDVYHNAKVQPKQFTIRINGFRGLDQNKKTSWKYNPIKYTDSIFRDLYGQNVDVFAADWYNKDIKGSMNKIAWDNVNSNPSKYFNNWLESTKIELMNTFWDTNEDWKLKVHPVFNGNNNGTYAQIEDMFKVELKPTPGIDNSKHKDISGFFNSIASNVENFVNRNGTIPSVNDLKKIIVDYVNERMQEIPKTMRPSSGAFTANDVVLNENFIDTSNLPIVSVKEGIIINTQGNVKNKIILPSFTFTVNETMLVTDTYRASHPINIYSVDELISADKGGQSWPKDFIKKWIVSNVEFRNYKNGTHADEANVIVKSFTKKTPNSMTVDFELDNAFTHGSIGKKLFRITITNFAAHVNGDTKMKYHEINYDSSEFKAFFGNDAYIYYADWANSGKTYIDQKNNDMRNVIDKNKSKYMVNTSSSTQVIDSTLTLKEDGFANKSDLKFVLKYWGNQNNVFKLLFDTAIIKLKQTPGADTGFFDGLDQKIQQWVDQNKRAPNANDVRKIIVDFINNKINQLPVTMRPTANGGRFTENDIKGLTDSLIDTSALPTIVIKDGSSIKTPGDVVNTINIPQITIQIGLTALKNNAIAATSPIDTFAASDIVLKASDGDLSDPEIIQIQDWLNQKTQLDKLFSVVSDNMSVVIKNISASKNNGKNAITVIVDVKNAITAQGPGTLNNIKFDITNFNGVNSNYTTLKFDTINVGDPNYVEIFGNNKGFLIDWEANHSNEELQINNFLTNQNNISKILNNAQNSQIKDVQLTMSGNGATVSFTYSGIDANGDYNNNISGTININLKPTPSANDSWLQEGIKDAIQGAIDNNNGILPDQDKIEGAIEDWLDQNKDKFPNATIPGGADGSFKPSGVIVTMPNIPEPPTDGNVNFPQVEVGTSSDHPITVPDIPVLAKITKVVNPLSVRGTEIAKYSPQDLISSNLGNEDQKNKIKTVIENNKNTIFNELPGQAIIKDVFNPRLGDHGKYSLKVDVILTQAYEVNKTAIDKTFTIELIDFNNTSTPSSPKEVIISAKTDINKFNQIFNFSGFMQDWQVASPSQLADLQNKLQDYMRANPTEFIDQPSQNSQITIISGFPAAGTDVTNSIFTVEYSFVGINDANEPVDLTGRITIELVDANQDPSIKDIILGFRTVVQNYVNNNGFPKTDGEWAALQGEIIDYLNKPENKSELPQAWIPEGGSFDQNNTQIEKTNVDTTNAIHGTVVFRPNAITTTTGIVNGEFTIDLSQSGITRQIANEISVGSDAELSKLIAQYVNLSLNDAIDSGSSNETEGSFAIKMQVEKFLKDNKNLYLINAENTTIEILASQYSDIDSTSITLVLKVKNAITVAGPNKDIQISLKLTDFNSNSGNSENTSWKKAPLDLMNTTDFETYQEIFGAGSTQNPNKGFALDWQTYTNEQIVQSGERIKQYINDLNDNEIQQWFDNPVTGLKERVVSVTPEPCDGSTYTTDPSKPINYISNDGQITYKVVFKAIIGTTIGEDTGTFAIKLKNFDKSDGSGVYDEFEAFANSKFSSNSEVPTEEEVKKVIAEYLNNNLDKIPNILIPPVVDANGQVIDRRYNPAKDQIMIDLDKTNFTQNGNSLSFIFDAGAIKVGYTDENGKAQYFTNPNISFTTKGLEVPGESDTNWIVWLVVGLSAGIFAITVAVLVIYIVRRKKSDDDGLLEMGF